MPQNRYRWCELKKQESKFGFYKLKKSHLRPKPKRHILTDI
jgi:hypothetical protein